MYFSFNVFLDSATNSTRDCCPPTDDALAFLFQKPRTASQRACSKTLPSLGNLPHQRHETQIEWLLQSGRQHNDTLRTISDAPRGETPHGGPHGGLPVLEVEESIRRLRGECSSRPIPRHLRATRSTNAESDESVGCVSFVEHK